MTGLLLWVKLVLFFAFMANLASWGLFLARRKSAVISLCAGWVASSILFGLNWVLCGDPPLGNMFHVHVVLALCFPPLFLLLSKREGLGWSGGYFAFATALSLLGAWFMEPDATWRRMPALQSYWFVPHVMAYMISYALATVAFVMTVTRWVRRPAAADQKRYRDAARSVIRMGFPFMTFGMLSGALWADDAWGTYWSWDPKETWSLITWLSYVIYLHCRFDIRTGQREDMVQAIAFLSLLWTFFLVNLVPRLSSVLHSYAG